MATPMPVAPSAYRDALVIENVRVACFSSSLSLLLLKVNGGWIVINRIKEATKTSTVATVH